jgi:hypothetical protein
MMQRLSNWLTISRQSPPHPNACAAATAALAAVLSEEEFTKPFSVVIDKKYAPCSTRSKVVRAE